MFARNPGRRPRSQRLSVIKAAPSLTLALLLPPILPARTAYSRHAVFDNSQQPDYYWNSSAVATAPSTLEQHNWRLPVETNNFLSPPNALRLHWRSEPGGGWDAEIHLVNFRNRLPELAGRTLYLCLCAAQRIAAADLPDLVLSDAREGFQVATFPGSFTAAAPLGQYAGDLPAGRWVQVRIPLMTLHSASVYAFDPAHLQSVIFHQGRADDAEHTLIVDQVRVDDDRAAAPLLGTPGQVSAQGYDRHVVVQWKSTERPGLAHYVIYRSRDGSSYAPVGIQLPGIHRFSDFLGQSDVTARYRVTAADWRNRESAPSATVTATTHDMSDDELLTILQEATFHYNWEGAEPHSGMAYENVPGE